jgi:hypothetical protein
LIENTPEPGTRRTRATASFRRPVRIFAAVAATYELPFVVFRAVVFRVVVVFFVAVLRAVVFPRVGFSPALSEAFGAFDLAVDFAPAFVAAVFAEAPAEAVDLFEADAFPDAAGFGFGGRAMVDPVAGSVVFPAASGAGSLALVPGKPSHAGGCPNEYATGFCAACGCSAPATTCSFLNIARPRRFFGSMPFTAFSTT